MQLHVRFRCPLAAVVLVASSSAAWAQDTPRPVLTVLVYNYAAAPAGWLRGARERAARIYRDAGVDVVWIDPLSDHERPSFEEAPSPYGTFTVRVMVRPKRNWGQRKSETDSVMGDALPADTCAGSVPLFYEQVLQVASADRQPIADVLALALAHEIGHVLLPPPSHSTGGIMRATWDGDDIRRAVLGQLKFTSAQASLIRKQVVICQCD